MFFLRYANELEPVTRQECESLTAQLKTWGATDHADDGTNLDGVPVGAILDWSVSTAPARWLLCNGAAYSRSTFARLFAVIGVTYGVGDGSTTFNVPNQAGVVGTYLIIYAGV